jgi:hypothetical protein
MVRLQQGQRHGEGKPRIFQRGDPHRKRCAASNTP